MPRGGKREGAGRKKKSAVSTPEAQQHTETPAPAVNPLALDLLQACTPHEQAFILELVAHPELPQYEAYRRSGYGPNSSDDTADANARKVLARDRVQAALNALRRNVLEIKATEAVMTGEEALGRLSLYARSDIGQIVGPDHPISKLPREARLVIKAVRPTRYGDVIELYDAMRATELMAKAGGKLKDHVEHSGKVTLEDLVAGEEMPPNKGAAA